ncbi:unnamed protein product, partial [Meganyctiphanes norvegica]
MIMTYLDCMCVCVCMCVCDSKLSDDSRDSQNKRLEISNTLYNNSSITATANFNTDNECQTRPLKIIKQFFNYIHRKSFDCKKLVHYGGSARKQPLSLSKFIDGDKPLCEDALFPFPRNDCIVYSFGINEEWSFDEAMAAKGCQVHSFDPTMEVGDHQHSPGVRFHNLGIGGTKGMVSIEGMDQKVPVDTLENIMNSLGHKKIYYLKMDVEGSEIPAFQQIFSNNTDILENIQQIGMEIHPGKYKALKEGRPAHLLLRSQIWSYFIQSQSRFYFGPLIAKLAKKWLKTYN